MTAYHDEDENLLASATPSDPTATGPEMVKALVWRLRVGTTIWEADSPVGAFTYTEDGWSLNGRWHYDTNVPQAAQAHYANLVMSAIDTAALDRLSLQLEETARRAYEEGYGEGMQEDRRFNGGKSWRESETYALLHRIEKTP